MRAFSAATETEFACEFSGNELAINELAKEGRHIEVLRSIASRRSFAG
jgi:hypothetical protein